MDYSLAWEELYTKALKAHPGFGENTVVFSCIKKIENSAIRGFSSAI